MDPLRAGSTTGADVQRVLVKGMTLESVLRGQQTPHYVKIDIEGADHICVRSVCRLAAVPKYLSFEADLAEPGLVISLLKELEDRGYYRFKLVNQALNPSLRPPQPAREGRFVNATFTHEMSGLFGAETPGEWQSRSVIETKVLDVARQQRARVGYAATGSVFGLRVGRWHTVLKVIYAAAPIVRARRMYADIRGREVGGWFDIHAELSDSVEPQ